MLGLGRVNIFTCDPYHRGPAIPSLPMELHCNPYKWPKINMGVSLGLKLITPKKMHLFHFTEKTGLGGPPFMTFCLLGAKVALKVMFKLYELISILRDPSQTQDIVRFCLGAGGGVEADGSLGKHGETKEV